MNTFMLMQVSDSVVAKSAEMAEKDPHGLIITLVAVTTVFSVLTILYFAYTLIGKAINTHVDLKSVFRRKKKADQKRPTDEEAAAIAMALDQEMNGEIYAAIGLALHRHLNETVHDNESYIITIRRR